MLTFPDISVGGFVMGKRTFKFHPNRMRKKPSPPSNSFQRRYLQKTAYGRDLLWQNHDQDRKGELHSNNSRSWIKHRLRNQQSKDVRNIFSFLSKALQFSECGLKYEALVYLQFVQEQKCWKRRLIWRLLTP